MQQTGGALWTFIPREQITAESYKGTIIPPFVHFFQLAQAGKLGGALVQNGCYVPINERPLCGIDLGGYVFSELFSLGSGRANWHHVATLLSSRKVAWLRAECPSDDESLTTLGAVLAQAKWRVVWVQGRMSPFIVFPEKTEDFYSYLKAVNPKEYRNVRSSWRKLQEAGPYNVRFVEGIIPQNLLNELSAIEQQSNKQGEGIFSPKNKNATMTLLQNNDVCIGLLYLHSQLIAWDLDIVHNNTVYSYNRAYNQAFSKFAPGKLLHYANLAHSWEKGISQAELLGDADALKMRIATGGRQRMRLIAFCPGILGGLAFICYSALAKMKPLVAR